MIFREEHKDLFSVDFKKYVVAHCISSDCQMGAGIAVPIRKKFKLGNLHNVESIFKKNPICVFHNKVYNLVTKKRYWHKPSYKSLGAALISMKIHAEQNKIKYIAMPKLGCGLDGLSWAMVRSMIKDIFENTDIEILVCHK